MVKRALAKFCLSCFLSFSFLIFSILLAPFAAAPAHAQEYFFDFSPSSLNGKQIKHDAGRTTFIQARFNSNTQRLYWKIVFLPAVGTNKLPDGLNLLLNTGFRPKGRQGEMAHLFFDATNLSAPKLTVYAYNGTNTDSSWQFSDMNLTKPADPILSSLVRTDWINELTVIDAPGQRTFIIDIDTLEINNHVPITPGSQAWRGVAFGLSIGIWSHPLSGSSATYGANGFLTQKGSGINGFVDAELLLTNGCDGVPGSNKQLDPCGVCGGDGTSCKVNPQSCNSKNIADINADLDRVANQLKRVVTSSLLALLRTDPKSTSLKKYVGVRNQAKEKFFAASWISAWSIPQVIVNCSVAGQCREVSLNKEITAFTSSINSLVAVARGVLRRLRSATGSNSKNYRRLKHHFDQAVDLLNKTLSTVPKSTFHCP